MSTLNFPHKLLSTAVLLLSAGCALAQDSTLDGVYTTPQATAGANMNVRSCIECHGATLRGSEAGPALTGAGFWSKWAGQSMAAFYQITASTMPVNVPVNSTTVNDPIPILSNCSTMSRK